MDRIGPDKIRRLLRKIDSIAFQPDVFAQTGVCVVRKVIPSEVIRTWQSEWNQFQASELSAGRKVNKLNPVAIEEKLPPTLATIHQHPALLDIVEKVFGPDIGLYNQRFVVKDRHSRGAVFLHHDSPYHLGFPSKASAFVPLCKVSPESGGMVFYPGTHQFGYLGDAGEINPDVLDSDWPVISPSLEPGDVVLMHSLTWHSSSSHISGPDRVLADIIYQPANDPSSIALLRGQWRTEIFLRSRSNEVLFKRSRTSMLKDRQAQLDQLANGILEWQSKA